MQIVHIGAFLVQLYIAQIVNWLHLKCFIKAVFLKKKL